jgi:hypothetical protein
MPDVAVMLVEARAALRELETLIEAGGFVSRDYERALREDARRQRVTVLRLERLVTTQVAS